MVILILTNSCLTELEVVLIQYQRCREDPYRDDIKYGRVMQTLDYKLQGMSNVSYMYINSFSLVCRRVFHRCLLK